jgi:hypothetical protein
MGDLLPCPFCGGEADYLPDRLMAPGAEPPVFCDGCHASALDAAAWNCRASGCAPVAPPNLVRELVDALEGMLTWVEQRPTPHPFDTWETARAALQRAKEAGL